jgi:hypothetical protein
MHAATAFTKLIAPSLASRDYLTTDTVQIGLELDEDLSV